MCVSERKLLACKSAMSDSWTRKEISVLLFGGTAGFAAAL